MTFRKPDEISTMRWIMSGFNLKTLVVAVVCVVSAHYVQGNRITVVEQATPAIGHRMDELEKRQDLQRDVIQKLRDSKVDLSTYEADQLRQTEELRAIRDSVGRIETILMGSQFSHR